MPSFSGFNIPADSSVSAPAIVAGYSRVNGRLVPGCTVYLIPASYYATFPADGDTIPVSAAYAVTTSNGNGRYVFYPVPQQAYWAAFAFGTSTGYEYVNQSTLAVGASGQLSLNASSLFTGNILEGLVDGTPLYNFSTGPSGGTFYASGCTRLNGPWSYAASTVVVPPAVLKLKQSILNNGTPASGAITYVNFNDCWAFGVMDNTNPSDTHPSFPPTGYTGGGNALFWADLRQNENRMILDSDGELRLETKNAINASNWYNFTLQKVANAGLVPSGVLQSGTGVGMGIGWRCVLPGGDAAHFQVEAYDINSSGITQTTRFSITQLNGGTLKQAVRFNEYLGMELRGSPTLAGAILPLLAIGDGGFGGNKWAGSVNGTHFGISAVGSFVGDFMNHQLSGTSKLRMTYDGTMLMGGPLKGNGTPLQDSYCQVAFASGDVTATSAQYSCRILELVGGLGPATTLFLPVNSATDRAGLWHIFNNTGGGVSITIAPATGVGASKTLGALKHSTFYMDSTGNVQKLSADN